MKQAPPARRRRVSLAALTAGALIVALTTTAGAQVSHVSQTVAPAAPVNAQRMFPAATGSVPSVIAARAALAREIGPGAIVQTDPLLGTLRWIVNLDGSLEGPSSAPPSQIALAYIQAHRRAFALSLPDLQQLRFRSDYVDILGTHHLSWIQTLNGVKIFGAGLKAAVASDGSLLEIAGPLYHVGQVPGADRPRLTSEQALTVARGGPGARDRVPGAHDTATLVRFPTVGVPALAWETVTTISSQEVDLSVIDAGTGRVLWRQNLVADDQPGTGLAWPNAPGPFPNGGGVAVPVSFPVIDSTALSGNNAHVFTSIHADDEIKPVDEIPASDPSTMTWNYPAVLNTTSAGQNCSATYPCTWDLTTPFSWQTNRRQEAVQAYALLNRYHDHLQAPPIGFTEAAGNFQVTNVDGMGGVGGDPVLAETLVGADLFNDGRVQFFNNASMYTPRDGQSPRLTLMLFRKEPAHPGYPSADSADDASVVFHEYTHGLSSRLVTMPDGSQALYGDQAGAMGEGWSDWYAMDALVADGYMTDTNAVDLPVGPWVTGGKGIRFQDADCLVGSSAHDCPAPAGTAGAGGFTYGDFGRIYRGPEVHSDGEIWLQTLWQLRGVLGSQVTEALVTRAMELSPQAPTFLDMRDAILVADTIAYGGSHQASIWQVFAERGMGFLATTHDGYDTSPHQDFTLPVSCPGAGCGSFGGIVVDPVSHKPVAGAVVRIAGGQSGMPVDLSATTDGAGNFLIDDVPLAAYPTVEVARDGYRTHVLNSVVVAGNTRRRIELVRDWVLFSGGATLVGSTGPDHTEAGGACGPRAAVDGSLSTSWLTSIRTPQWITIELPQAIHLLSFGVDPTAICAGRFSDTKAFDIYTRRAVGPWILAYRTTAQLPANALTAVRPRAGALGVRFVRLVLRSAAHSTSQAEFTEMVVRGVV
jgi:extracellular elastinolytic metalloproteinase